MFTRKIILVSGLLLAMMASQSAWAQQYARPASTTTAAGWSPVGAGTLHEAVDEISANDSDYMNSGDGNVSTVVLGLSNVNDPGTYTNNHILRFRCQATGGKGGDEYCNAEVYNGGALIFSTGNVIANRGAFTASCIVISNS